MNALQRIRDIKYPTPLQSAVMLYGDDQATFGEPEAIADAENAAKELLEMYKLLSRIDVAFRSDISQPEANDYYWKVRQDLSDKLKTLEAGNG